MVKNENLKFGRKALSPLIAVILLTLVAVSISGLLLLSTQQIARLQSNSLDLAQTQANCNYAGLQIRSCGIDENGLSFSLQNSGGLDLINGFNIQLIDANGNLIQSSLSNSVNVNTTTDFNSDDFDDPSLFLNTATPITSLRITSKSCPQIFSEVSSCVTPPPPIPVLTFSTFHEPLDNNVNVSDQNNIAFTASVVLDRNNTWGSPTNISNLGVYARGPEVVKDSSDNLYLVWKQDNAKVYYSEYFGSSWSSPVVIDVTSNNSDDASIVVNGSTRLVAYRRFNGVSNPSEIYVSTSSDGSTWATPINLTGNLGGSFNYYSPRPFVDGFGNLYVFWIFSTIRYSKSIDGGVTWGSPVDTGIAANGGGFDKGSLDVKLTSDGYIHLHYINVNAGIFKVYHVKSTDGGSTWSSPVLISDNFSSTQYVDSVVDSSDNLYTVFVTGELKFSKSIDGGSTWSMPSTIGAGTTPKIDIGIDGSLHVAGLDTSPAGVIYYYSSDAGASWSLKQSVYTKNGLSEPQPAALSDSTVKVFFNDNTADIYFVSKGFYQTIGYLISTVIDFVAQNIIGARIDADSLVPSGTGLNFYLSNDNGYSWSEVTNGVDFNFSSTGSDLKWKADLNTSNNSLTSKIIDVNVTYWYWQ